jgi:hypothetical protein
MKLTQFAQDLREALGAESVGLWIYFMDKIAATLPFLLSSAGRPKIDEVRGSAIGEAGFDSWFAMVEASPEKGGLGWSIDSWKAWKRAYSIVLKNNYLRGLELTASEINMLSREIQPFPASKASLDVARIIRKNELDAKRGNAVSSLKGQLSEAEKSVASLTAQLTRATADRESLKEKGDMRDHENTELNNKYQQALGKLNSVQGRLVKLEALISQKDVAIEKQKKQIELYSQMTRLDHLKAVFTNRTQSRR